MRFFGRSIVLMMFLLATAAVFAAPLLKAGDRMVFLGDSITQQMVYTRYVMNYFSLRYPGVDISFRNAGWNGDTAPGGLNRLTRDVLSLKPTVVSICYGMNDGKVTKFNDANYDVFLRGMTGLVTELKKAGVKVVLLTPGCVDTDRKPSLKGDDWNYNETLAKFGSGVKELAAKEKLPFFDLHMLMLDVQTKAKKDNPQFTMIPDAVHPLNPGQAVMAYALLRALGCDLQASGLEIDAAKSTAKPDRCKVSELKVADAEISFTRTDEALPAWFDADAAPVMKYFSLVETLNQYKFTVTGLKTGNWKLVVEGIPVGTFSNTALATGVNLATLPGPWLEEGKRVNNLSTEQENLYFQGWRTIGMGVFPKEAATEQQALANKIIEVVATKEKLRQKAAVGRTWKWVLTAQ